MRHVSRPAVALSTAVAVLSVAAALVGLLATGGDAPRSVTSVHGEAVELYGQGLYRNETTFKGAGYRGSDLVTLVLGVPLLVVALVRYRKGSIQGGLLLAGALAWPLYVYATMAVGATYNGLFLVYVALFGSSLLAFVLTVLSVDRAALAARLRRRAPWRRAAALMLGGGVVTSVVWLAPLATAAMAGDPPELLGHQTTMVTDALDLAVVMPATLTAAYLLHRRRADGYLVAFPLLVLLTFLLPMIAAQTVFQVRADVSFTPGELVGPISGFTVLAALALGLVVAVLRAVGEHATDARPPTQPQEAAATGAGQVSS